MSATVITFLDGNIVAEDADTHFARIESEREISRHVANINGLSERRLRAEYLANLERRQGVEAMAKVRDAFGKAWAARKGAA